MVKVAWISYFPIEWLPGMPPVIQALPKLHPATWQRVLLDEFKTRPDLQLEIIVVRKQFPSDLEVQWENVRFHCLKVPGGARSLSLFWWETLRIRKRLRRIQPDLVHAWGTERGAAMVASRLGYPYLVTMQGLLQWYSQHVNLGPYHQIDIRLEDPSLRRARVATTESGFAVRWLKEHYPRLEVRQAEHAPNWVFHRIRRRPELQPLRFLFIGVLSAIKGTDLLFRALDQLQEQFDFRLGVVGSGAPEFVAELKRNSSTELWRRIEFRAQLQPAEVAEELARAAIMLFPTRVDTSPNSVKEAAVAGLPVVASAIGGIVDYIQPGRNGITFPAGDLAAFVAAIREAVAHPRFSLGQVDPATLAETREYLSPAVMASKFFAGYERVLRLASGAGGPHPDKPSPVIREKL